MMEEKRDTKKILAESFKELLSKNNIEKITVSDITEMSGVIRPTFYNHFRDKYELLEYIIWNDLMLPIKPLLINDLITEGLTLLFSSIKNEREFYKRAIKIEGQNSFESIARNQVGSLLGQVIKEKNGITHNKYKWLSADVVASYYAQAMVCVAIEWIKSDFVIPPKELSEIYNYITKRSMIDVIKDLT